MGSMSEPYSPDHHGDILAEVGKQLPTVTEEDARTKSSDTSPEGDLYDSSSSDHAAKQRSAKRQRKGFSCEACHMTFTEKRALARHKKTDHHRKQIGLPPDRKHACTICGKYFTRGHDLKRHQNEQHPDSVPSVPSIPMESSSGSSEGSSEQPSDNSSSIRSVSQASNATDNTSLFALAEPLPASEPHSAANGMLSDSSDAKFAYFPMDIEEEGHRVLRHFRSEPNIKASTQRQRRGPARSRLSDVEDADEFDMDIDERPYEGSDCGRDALSDHLDQLPASARQLPFTLPANAELLAQLPTKPYDVDSWQTPMCMLCGDAFQDDTDELLKHLRKHLDSFRGEARCKSCRIDFVHESDLQKHLQSAAEGHCGFNFPHFCTGHHPPVAGERSGGLSNYDRARLCVRLQNWGQAQLQAYIAEIGELTAARQTRRLARWSDVLRGSSRRNSFASFAISVNSHATAPCDVSNGKTDLGGLQKRMQQMSLGNAGARVRRLIHPGSSDVRTRTIDRSLQKAIKHEDLRKVKDTLEMGADPRLLHEYNGQFIVMALWGLNHVSGLIAEHRLDEDIVGSCSVCHISTEKFEKGQHKVEALLRHQADPNIPGGLCGYPLATAAWMGRPDIVRLLLQYGADVQGQPRGTYGSALCAAAAQTGGQGHMEVIRLLIRRGADVHARGPQGTPLELAHQRRDYWMMKMLNQREYDDDITGRIPCCDEVIMILEAEENKPFKRCATPALGGIAEEQPIGNQSKLSFPMGKQPGLRLIKSWDILRA